LKRVFSIKGERSGDVVSGNCSLTGLMKREWDKNKMWKKRNKGKRVEMRR
jgi:hypothetical protein